MWLGAYHVEPASADRREGDECVFNVIVFCVLFAFRDRLHIHISEMFRAGFAVSVSGPCFQPPLGLCSWLWVLRVGFCVSVRVALNVGRAVACRAGLHVGIRVSVCVCVCVCVEITIELRARQQGKNKTDNS